MRSLAQTVNIIIKATSSGLKSGILVLNSISVEENELKQITPFYNFPSYNIDIHYFHILVFSLASIIYSIE